MEKSIIGNVTLHMFDKGERLIINDLPEGSSIRYYGDGSGESEIYLDFLSKGYRVKSENAEDVRAEVVFFDGVSDFPYVRDKYGATTVYIAGGHDFLASVIEINRWVNKSVDALCYVGASVELTSERASAYAGFVSKLLFVTDCKLSATVNGNAFNAAAFDSVRKEIIIGAKSGFDDFGKSLATKFSGVTAAEIVDSGEMQMERIISRLFRFEQRICPPVGIVRLVCALVMCRIYISFLSSDFGFVAPPDNNLRLEQLSEYLGISEEEALKSMRSSIDEKKLEVFRRALRLYRGEFTAELCYDALIFRKALVKVKKTLPDYGLAVDSALSESDLRLAVAHSADVMSRGCSLATIMKNTGVMDDFL